MLSLAYLLDADANPQYAEDYEYNYFNLRKLIVDMSPDTVENDIANIAVPNNVRDSDIWRVQKWMKNRCNCDNYFGSDVDQDLPWVKDMVLDRNHIEYYVYIFIRDMAITSEWLLEKWTEAIGHAPEFPDDV